MVIFIIKIIIKKVSDPIKFFMNLTKSDKKLQTNRKFKFQKSQFFKEINKKFALISNNLKI